MKRYNLIVLILCVLATTAFGADWLDDLLQLRAEERKLPTAEQQSPLPGFDDSAYTISLWVKTRGDGALWAMSKAKGSWTREAKALFVHGGAWGGYVQFRDSRIRSNRTVNDDKWHHVVFVNGHTQQIWIDGNLQAEESFPPKAVPKDYVFKIGAISESWGKKPISGLIDDVQVYPRPLSEKEVQALFTDKKPVRDCVVHCSLDGPEPDQQSGHRAKIVGKATFKEGKIGKALCPAEGYLEIAPNADTATSPWEQLDKTHSADALTAEMTAVRRDGIWGCDWAIASPLSIAARYAAAVQEPAYVAKEIQAKARAAKTDRDLKAIHDLYLKSFHYTTLMATLGNYELGSIAKAIHAFYKEDDKGLLARLKALEAERDAWTVKLPEAAALAAWKSKVNMLRLTAVLGNNPNVDFDKILFVTRKTYSANHYYTKHINSRWLPGGNLCVLNTKTGKTHELVPELKDGVFERFDLSFDASKIVFAWKSEQGQGYRLYEIDIDPKTGQRTGTPVRSLTLPPQDEAEIQKKYSRGYHHGTDDMQPCYLPDGGIAFVSTRCQYGILCDSPDIFTTSILYRMDGDGKNMKKLTNSSVSENSPAVLNDGRIMYTRWEYLDKGAVSVKCLWAMNPDGSRSVEIYGADIALPPTMIHGRPIPGSSSEYVFLGVPHYPQNNMGTVIRIDMTKDIRTREPMTYMTPYVDIKGEGGFSFQTAEGRWRGDARGRGRLFADPYPLSKDLFLVSHKPAGKQWQDETGYSLYLLKESGQTFPFHSEADFSCWEPYPLKARKPPQIPSTPIDTKMAAKKLATCMVTDIYHGLEDVERGSIKFIRVLEQIPRPWATRRRWGGDEYDQQHATITKDTHLGLKVQHGIVPVEEDGSAHFVVPSMANIFFQVLDKNYLAVQTERTYVNYMPGEIRSCIGCHETPKDVPANIGRRTPKALTRAASVPGPQPGEKTGQRPLDFAADVQPVLDKHCISCHGEEEPKAGLDLRGTMTSRFSVSYESLLQKRRGGELGRDHNNLLFPTVGENHPKTGNVHYLPTRSLGSHNSLLVAMLIPGGVQLKDQALAEKGKALAEKHKDLKLKPEELLKITNWVDTNGQYYGMYWGRKNLTYREHPNFRPVPTFKRATSYESLIPEKER